MISAVIQYADNKVSIHSAETEIVGKTFKEGFYEATTDSRGNMHITAQKLNELHTPYNSKETEVILKTVKNFFKKGIKERVNDLGFTHKLGILLYGKQGTSKTSLMNYVADLLVRKKKAVVLFCNNENTFSTAVNLASNIREIQDNPIIFIADESSVKNLLDGVDSVENSLFLAATNYLDKVPATIKDRPSRFKVVQELKGITDKNTMKLILMDISSKVAPNVFTEEEIEETVKVLQSVTLDELKHVILDKVTENYLPKQISRPTIGFKNEEEDEEDIHDILRDMKVRYIDDWEDDDEVEIKTDTNI